MLHAPPVLERNRPHCMFYNQPAGKFLLREIPAPICPLPAPQSVTLAAAELSVVSPQEHHCSLVSIAEASLSTPSEHAAMQEGRDSIILPGCREGSLQSGRGARQQLHSDGTSRLLKDPARARSRAACLPAAGGSYRSSARGSCNCYRAPATLLRTPSSHLCALPLWPCPSPLC